MRMKKVLFILLTLSIFVFIFAAPAAADTTGVVLDIFPGKAYMDVNRDGVKNTVRLDIAPVSINGSTYIPLHGVLEQIFVYAQWDKSKNMVTITKGNTIMKVEIGSDKGVINENQIVNLSAPVKLVKGNPMLPMKPVLQYLGVYNFSWDNKLNKITVTEQIVYNFNRRDYEKEKIESKTYGKYICYINTIDQRKLYRKNVDGKYVVVIRNAPCYELFGVNEDGVFVRDNEDRGLYKLNLDGTHEQLMLKGIDYVTVKYVGAHEIYYTKINYSDYRPDRPTHLYVMNTKTMEIQKVADSPVIENMLIDADGCYFYKAAQTKLYKLDFKQKELVELCGDAIGDMILDDGWIYYCNLSDHGSLYRIKADGSGRRAISPNYVKEIRASGEYIYYVNLCDQNKMYKVKKTGGQSVPVDERTLDRDLALEYAGIEYRTKPLSMIFPDIAFPGSTVYYIEAHDNCKLYKVNKDGTGLTRITDERVRQFIKAEGFIYYIGDTPDIKDSTLYRIKEDGTGKVAIARGMIDNIKVYKSDIYFSMIDFYNYKNQGIFRAGTTDTRATCIFEGYTSNVSVRDDVIYFINIKDFSKLYRMSLYGGDARDISYVAYVSGYGVSGEWITFSVRSTKIDESGKTVPCVDTYKMKLDGSERQRISQ